MNPQIHMELLITEFIKFFRAQKLVDILMQGDYHLLWHFEGVKILLNLFVPCLLVYELIYLRLTNAVSAQHFKINFLIYLASRVIANSTIIGIYAILIPFFGDFALFKTELNAWSAVYTFIVLDFANYVNHYLGHKIRFLWCIHTVHHIPEEMTLSVTLAVFGFAFLVEVPIVVFICMFLGANATFLPFALTFARIWGDLLHISETLLPDGRLGILQKWLITPMHHRLHHARNLIYLDVNFGSFLNLWDKMFKTFRVQSTERPIYGVARPVNMNHFLDIYFGEFQLLWMDIQKAPRLKHKILYLIMPPGWCHTGTHQTVTELQSDLNDNATN